jgi:hypothetical protein
VGIESSISGGPDAPACSKRAWPSCLTTPWARRRSELAGHAAPVKKVLRSLTGVVNDFLASPAVW